MGSEAGLLLGSRAPLVFKVFLQTQVDLYFALNEKGVFSSPARAQERAQRPHEVGGLRWQGLLGVLRAGVLRG